MDNTLITPLDGIKPRAFTDPESAIKFVNKVSLAIFLYIVLVIYPAYGLLRGFWLPDFPIVDLEGIITAILVGGLFALFARRSIISRVTGQTQSAEQDN